MPARIELAPFEALTGPIGELAASWKAMGSDTSFIRMLNYRADLVPAFFEFYMRMRGDGLLPARLKELVRLRIASAPNVATMAEGLPGFAVTNDLFLLTTGGMPAAAISRISGALQGVLAQKDLQDAYLAQGAIVEWLSTEDVTARIRRDIERWRSLSKEAGIKPQ